MDLLVPVLEHDDSAVRESLEGAHILKGVGPLDLSPNAPLFNQTPGLAVRSGGEEVDAEQGSGDSKGHWGAPIVGVDDPILPRSSLVEGCSSGLRVRATHPLRNSPTTPDWPGGRSARS